MNQQIADLAKRAEITKEMRLTEWTVNAFKNYPFLKSHPAPHLGEYMGKKSGPCIILGSGRTLDYAYEHILKAAENPESYLAKADIFAGPSQAMGLAAHGIIPDYIVGHDSHPVNFDYLRPDRLDWGERCTLMCHPSFDPLTISEWRGKRIMFRLSLPYHESMITDRNLTIKEFMDKYRPDPETPVGWYFREEYLLFLRNTLLRAFPEIPLGVMSASCTPVQTMIIADLMGYNPIFLVGNDNCYMDNRTRCDTWLFNPITGKIERQPDNLYTKSDDIKISLNGKETTDQLLAYATSTVTASKGIKASIVELTDFPGALDFFPVMSWDWSLSSTEEEIDIVKNLHGLNENRLKAIAKWLEKRGGK